MSRSWNFRRHQDRRIVNKRIKQVNHWGIDDSSIWHGWVNHGLFGLFRKRQLAAGRGVAYNRKTVINGRKGKWEKK